MAVAGTALAAVPLVVLAVDGTTRSMFDGSFVVDEFALVLKASFVVSAYLVLLMSHHYIESDRYYQGEYYFLLLASLLGSLVMASSRDLIILFIGLELTTGPLYPPGRVAEGRRQVERGLDEVLHPRGSLDRAPALRDVVALRADRRGHVRRSRRGRLLASPTSRSWWLPCLGLIVGFGFKISAVPFHFWAPDTYEGAPTPVTAYLSVNSKAAGFVALLLIMYQALPDISEVWAPALWILAAASMTVGNLAALRQTNIVRLLAYSSIAQAGFMLVPFAAAAVAGADLAEAFSATVSIS